MTPRNWAFALAGLGLAVACGADEQVVSPDASLATGGAAGASFDAAPDVTAEAGAGGQDAAKDGGASDAVADASEAGGDGEAGDAADPLAPDFLLVDENPNSTTYQTKVSPRDYLGKVSAWYFGQAT